MFPTRKTILKVCKKLNLNYSNRYFGEIYYTPSYDTNGLYFLGPEVHYHTDVVPAKGKPKEIEICNFSKGCMDMLGSVYLISDPTFSDNDTVVNLDFKRKRLIFSGRKLEKELKKCIQLIENVKYGSKKFEMEKKLKDLQKDF